MAETVKKSRFVSERDENMEESLLEEFNIRLKECMSRDDLRTTGEENLADENIAIYENIDIFKETIGAVPVPHCNGNSTQEFLQVERIHYDLNGHAEEILDKPAETEPEPEPKPKQNSHQPSLNLPTTCLISPQSPAEVDNPETKSVKDRMFLSTDDASCLLFTQTVTSPMLTPSEENVDFLKGFRRESTQTTMSDNTNASNSPKSEPKCDDIIDKIENIYENVEMYKNNFKTSLRDETRKFLENEIYYVEKSCQPETNSELTIVDNQQSQPEVANFEEHTEICNDNEEILIAQIKTNGNDESIKSVEIENIDNVNDLKSLNIIKQISKFENTVTSSISQEFTNVCSNIGVSTVTESHFVETTTEIRSTNDSNNFKKKKSKKSKNQHEKENISVKSSFSKFDALQKKNMLNAKSAEHENGVDASNCKKCSRPVFQMEKVIAERCIYHRNCFRCVECSKQLLVDNFESHEGALYCKPHFKALFTPKAVEDDIPSKPQKHELIIRENQPAELPPDVARASDKPDLGLEELHSLNVKERFQVFENAKTITDNHFEKNTIKMERSPSILSKLARFQAKGMNVGVTDDSLNGVPIEASSSEEEEAEEEIDGEDADLVRAKRVQKEKPFHFSQMSDVKSKWEQGNQQKKDDLREERKQEIQNIRSRLFLGKQGKMKEAYQQAILESESGLNHKKELLIESADTQSIKNRFEKGDIQSPEIRNKESEDMSVFESGISKQSRSIFQELDATGGKPPQLSPSSPIKLGNSVRNARESKTPDREIYVDPDIIRSEDQIEDSVVAKTTHTATKMLNKFRQMEENLLKGQESQGPKPLKRFTPPREPIRRESSSDEESGSEEESGDEIDNSRMPERDLIEAQKAARAKKLRAKFESWEENEIRRENSVNLSEEVGDDQSQIETARSLRAKFESLRESNSSLKQPPRVKVNRFV